ncbi:MAG: 30S ribosomal protein S6 [Chthoniobacterales bacterium]|jgi:small subunit ribosomal protein S6
MKNRYEILLALNVAGKEETNKDLIERLEKTLNAEGAKVEQVQRLERREFSYPHNKLKSAYFVNFIANAESDAIAKIRTKLALDEEVILQNYLRKGAAKPAGKARKAAKKTAKAA